MAPFKIGLYSKCRICLQEEEDMNSFFEPFFEGLSLADVFRIITSLEFYGEEELPKNICMNCTMMIINFNNLVTTFQESELLLKKSVFNVDIKKENQNFIVKPDLQTLLSGANDDGCVDTKEVVQLKNESKGSDENNREKNLGEMNECENARENNNDHKEMVNRVSVKSKKCISHLKTRKHFVIEEENVKLGEIIENKIDAMKYSCESCGDCFLIKVGFRQHMHVKHKIDIDDDQLEQYSSKITIKVPASFSEVLNSSIKTSKLNYVGSNNLQCRICKEKIFSTVDEVKKHEEIHKTHVCFHCGASFLKKHYLTDHLVIHSEARRYSCKVCGKKFKHRHGLNAHRNIHESIRSFVCDSCGNSFKAISTLKTHMMLKHSDKKNYPCSGCNLSFKIKSWRDKHYFRKHTSNREKKFECLSCSVAYLDKTTLSQHILEKHSLSPKLHQCPICSKLFRHKNPLSKHLQNRHDFVENPPNPYY